MELVKFIRDNSIFNWREMNSLIDYEAAPVAKKFQDSCNKVKGL